MTLSQSAIRALTCGLRHGAAANEIATAIDVVSAAGDVAIANGTGLIVGHATQETVSNGDGTTDMIPELQVLGTTQADSSMLLACFNTTNTIAPTLAFAKGGNAAIGSHTIVANDEYVGRIVAFGDDGVDLETPVAEIRFVVDDTGGPGAGAIGGSIELYTTADGGSTLTKAVTVDTAQGVTCAGALSVTGVSTLTGNNLAITAGTGITGGSGTSIVSGVEKVGTMFKTTIAIDLAGLRSTAGGDIIGVNGTANPCHIGQITAARNGTIFAGKITCLEAPTGGDPDIDLFSATAGDAVEDTAISGVAGQAKLIDSGDFLISTIKSLTAYPAADTYLYLVAGDTTDADYSTGILVIELWGK